MQILRVLEGSEGGGPEGDGYQGEGEEEEEELEGGDEGDEEGDNEGEIEGRAAMGVCAWCYAAVDGEGWDCTGVAMWSPGQ
jgi:hypothetical protein